MRQKTFFAIVTIAVTLFASTGVAAAGVDVNTADQAALDGIKGLGPNSSKAIIAERSEGGIFKDWSDFQTRVKGIREKSASKLSAAGLTINGQSKSASILVMKAAESASTLTEVTTSK
jgi:competence protein ComEA